MLEILAVENRIDKNNKPYKYFTILSPEQPVPTKFGSTIKYPMSRKKICGYISYEVNYAESQSSDPFYDLEVGDKVPGLIVTKKVAPYPINGEIQTKCSVPVFWPIEDMEGFKDATDKAFKRAGKILYNKENITRIPEGCVII